MRDFEADMLWSSWDFKNIIWPVINSDNSSLVIVEGIEDADFKNFLDKVCGIDFIKASGLHCHGIAARIQENRSYEQFSVRTWRDSGTSTEKEKRQEYVKFPGSLGPFYVVQGFVDKGGKTKVPGGTLMSVAMIETKVLIEFMEEHPDCVENHSNKDGRSGFESVPWFRLLAAGAPMAIWPKEVSDRIHLESARWRETIISTKNPYTLRQLKLHPDPDLKYPNSDDLAARDAADGTGYPPIPHVDGGGQYSLGRPSQ
jgi:hypothetical protein